MPARSSEKDIHRFLAAHPYLIDSRFKGARIQNELSSSNGRLDILIEQRQRHTIVELKKVSLDESAVEQLERYVETFSDKFRLTSYHYLVGKSPTDPARFRRKLGKCAFKIHARFLGIHIPLTFVFNDQLRRYEGDGAPENGISMNRVSFLL